MALWMHETYIYSIVCEYAKTFSGTNSNNFQFVYLKQIYIMTRNLLMASFLFAGIYGSAQTVVFEDDFNDPAKVALWQNTDRDPFMNMTSLNVTRATDLILRP